MKTNQIGISFSDEITPTEEFIQFEKIITDRGSKYSVSGGFAQNRKDIKNFLKKLKSQKKYAKATHNTYAARVKKDHQIFDLKNDDGETGAGAVILRILQKQNLVNCIIVVTRWYGGIKLQGDRFRHVQDATKYFCEKIKQ